MVMKILHYLQQLEAYVIQLKEYLLLHVVYIVNPQHMYVSVTTEVLALVYKSVILINA